MGGKRTTFQDPVTGRWTRVCRSCKQTKDLEHGFYCDRRGENDEPVRWSHECKVCTKERTNAYYHEKMSIPHLAERERARQRRNVRSWRARNREREHAAKRRYRAKLLKDRARHARILENRRIRTRARRESEGKPTNRRMKTATKASDSLPKLPAAPLAALVDEHVRRVQAEHDLERGDHNLNGASAKSVCSSLGIDERMLRAWRTGERVSVQFDVADRVLTALGVQWHDVWDPDAYPDVAERLTS